MGEEVVNVTALAPLRAVVERGPRFDLLECGHALGLAQDNYGYRYPSSRRCWKCRDGFPVDQAPDGALPHE